MNRSPSPSLALAMLAVLTIAAGVVNCTERGNAQSGNWGDGHHENHDWYRTLKDRRGLSCCNGDESHGDCRPVQAKLDQNGAWQAFIGGAWKLVPPEAVLDPNVNRQPLHAHVCATRETDHIYCFVPGGAGG
jgi:hypothetical protein